MNDLQIDFDWQDPGRAKGDELRATWASLSISVGGTRVTEFLDRKSKTVRSSIFLPLFPLAEWIADNWWFLTSEVETPDDPRDAEFDRRHNLRWAREGFVLPSLRFVTLGEGVAVEWRPLEIPNAAIQFLSNGNASLPARIFVQRLQDFVNAVIMRLDESGVAGTTLHEQWLAIEIAGAEEQEFCRASGRLGVDPYAIDEHLESELLQIADTIRSELLDDFLSVSNVDDLSDQASALQSATEAIAADAETVDALASLRAKAPPVKTGASPWDTGYRYAAELRKALNDGAWSARSLEELAGHLSIDQVERCVLPKHFKCRFFDALVGTNQCANPKFIIEKARPDSKQFAFCRALFEHLTLPHGRFAAVSRLRTERQQMNRAFAAEFLAPNTMLRSDLSGATVGEEEIEDLAADYGVSVFVIRHQLENHQLARVSV